MKTLPISIILFFLCSLCISCEKESVQHPSDEESVDYSNHPRNRYYSQKLMDYYSSNHLPGAILAVQKEGEPLWIGALGRASISDDVVMKTSTQFRTGSISKVFTATLIMQLKEKKLLSLEDKLADLLPEVKGNIPSAEKITIRQLLNHSSGLPHPSDEDSSYQNQIINDPEGVANMSIEDKLKTFVYGKELKFEPGTASAYSNPGYWLLGKIIEKITHQPLEVAMEQLLFKPYELSQTYLETEKSERVAKGYYTLNGQLTEVTIWDMADSRNDPSGGVVSSASDICRFIKLLFSGNILSAASLEEMKQTSKFPTCPNGDCEYGLGIESWNVKSDAGFGKNGTLPGVDANFIYFPAKQTTLVIFTNYGGGSHKNIIEEILNSK